MELGESVRAPLRRLATSLTAEVRQAPRAKMVLAAADGLTNVAIARELNVGVNTVRKWRGRFATGGPRAPNDAIRCGRPRIYGSTGRRCASLW
ncbi:helix-turn-helix domain-containing protein [Streptomyces sp. NBC_01166]|uniref:helix-turn-helix domain-containing protein n=1 Tax=Streptomyces sp. NBC_01166 TaxID=2903755 RepID=UPI0038645F00